MMLSLKYIMQELSLNDMYVSRWSFGKCKLRRMRPVLNIGTFSFSPKILSPKILRFKKFALVRPGRNVNLRTGNRLKVATNVNCKIK